MKIFGITPFNISFNGKREDRKTIQQLQENNKYDLNLMNQRRISNAIENLSNESGEENVKFLLDVSENLKYGTNIDLNKASFNDWRVKLNNAAEKSLKKSPKNVQEKMQERLEKASTKKPLNEDEKTILALRENILSQVDKKQLANIKDNNIKELQRNLDYFIVSSEVPLAQKLHILKQLNKFMGPEYKINPQLKDRKTQALAEIVNDIVVDTPESKIPNIKSINQKSFSMCGAISIARKALAYEDKANFVDMVMSELDATPNIQVFDITKLGTNTKIPIKKNNIDYNYALERGFRIIDTSALIWMHMAYNLSPTNKPVGMFSAFDKEGFDTFEDSTYLTNLDDTLVSKQDYLRALQKTQNAIKEYRKDLKDIKRTPISEQLEKAEMSNKYIGSIEYILTDIDPTLDTKKKRLIIKDLLSLQVRNSDKINRLEDYQKDFAYIPNETDSAKTEKIKTYLAIALPNHNSETLDKKVPDIIDLVSRVKGLESHPLSYKVKNYIFAKDLYSIAAKYSNQRLYQLQIPEQVENLAISLNIPDRESLISKNIDSLIKKLEKNKLDPRIMQELAKNFSTENDPEILIEALKANQETLNYIMTKSLDSLYNANLCSDRKQALITDIEAVYNEIKSGKNKEVLETIANNLHTDANKKVVLNTLEKYMNKLSSENCTDKEYIEILNNVGKKNQMEDFKRNFLSLGEMLFDEKAQNPAVIAGFNLINGLAEDAPLEKTAEVYTQLGKNFDEISLMTTYLQKALYVEDNNEVLNAATQDYYITKELERIGEITPAKDLEVLQERFTKIENYTTPLNGQRIRLNDLPKEYFQLTPKEKEILKNIANNVNKWNSATKRSLQFQYNELKPELREAYRKAGLGLGIGFAVEGSSGLYAQQEIAIYERMTDRPYHTERNNQVVIDTIEKSPYSGTSATSVSHTEMANHAQYISDIAPIEITKDGKKIKTKALFQDNTWGPSEHENTWIDENGLERTDYSNKFGGELGYITNNKYQNGKILENLFQQYVVVNEDKVNEIKYPMYMATNISGESPKAKIFAEMIKDLSVISPISNLEDLEEIVKTMPHDEVIKRMKRIEDLGNDTVKDFQEIKKRIDGDKLYKKGIKTKEDYNKLSENDEIKLLFDKIAILQTYPGFGANDNFFKKSSAQKLKDLKAEIRETANKNFAYAFGKNPEVIKYGISSIKPNILTMLKDISTQHNIKFNKKDITRIFADISKINKENFDGNSDTTIKLITQSFERSMQKNIPDFKNKNAEIKDMANQVQNLLSTKMEFTLANLDSSSSDMLPKNIINWIDNNFNPTTDEEFVQIFKRLQKMPTKEFYEKYGSTINDESLNIKNVTGFEILEKFNNQDETTTNTVFNTLYFQNFGYENFNKTKTVYDFNKFAKVRKGDIYLNNQKTFDNTYMDLYFSFKNLNIEKSYKPYHEELFKNNGGFLVYPKTEIKDAEEVDNAFVKLFDEITESISMINEYKSQDQSLKIMASLNQYISKFKDNSKLSKSQRERIETQIKEFLELNEYDESIQQTLNAANNILQLDESATSTEYKKFIKDMDDEMSMFSSDINQENRKNSIRHQMNAIDKKKKDFVMNLIDPEYQQKAYKMLNEWIQMSSKNKDAIKTSQMYAIFQEKMSRHLIVDSPEKTFNEYLSLLSQTPEDLARKYSHNELKHIDDIKNVYATQLRGFAVLSNVQEIQETIVRAKEEGCLNTLNKHLQNLSVELLNGEKVKLNSEKGIGLILRPIRAADDDKLFTSILEDLGLTELYLEYLYKNTKYDDFMKYIKRIDNIYSAVSEQTLYTKKELDKLADIDNDPNYEARVLELKEKIIKKCKRTNFSITSKLVDKGLTNALNSMKENPQNSKLAYLNFYLENIKQGSIYVASEKVRILNEQLMLLQREIDTVKKLKLPEGSRAEALQKAYLAKIDEIEDFTTAHTKKYEGLGITTHSDRDIEELKSE